MTPRATRHGFLLLCSATLASGAVAQAQQQPAGPDPAAAAAEIARGQRVYTGFCASCHGRRGDGRGPAARFLAWRPRDFTKGVYKFRSTPSGALPTDGDLVRSIRRGAPGTPMPTWRGRIPGDDIVAVARFVKTFSPRFRTEERPRPIRLPPSVPPLDAAAERRGRVLYALMQCWTCHGVRGDGRGPAADTLVDDEGRPAVAYDFTNGRFHGGARPIDVYRTFTTGVNGTPMPAYEEALLVGSDAFPDLAPIRPALDPAGMRLARSFLRSMPTNDQIAELPDAERERRASALRWDLVAYVLSLSRGSSFLRWLGAPLYDTR